MLKNNGVLSKVNNSDIELLEKNPEEFWKGVEVISSQSFINNDRLKEIIIPESVKKIESCAFVLCRNLERVVMADSIENIGHGLFEMCRDLKEVHLSEKLTKIPPITFYMCANLEKVNIPNSVKYIGVNAFLNCWKLKEIKLPEGLETIEGQAFCDTGLTKLEIPESVNVIGNMAFAHCALLEEVSIPESASFASRIKVNNNLEVDKGLNFYNDAIQFDAFYNTPNLKSVNIIANVTRESDINKNLISIRFVPAKKMLSRVGNAQPKETEQKTEDGSQNQPE